MQPATGVVIAHHHPQGVVAPDMLAWIAHLVGHVTPHVILVSTHISASAQAEAARLCRVIARANVGYDFWSYKLGLDALGWERGWQRLLLINSSIVLLAPERLAQALFAPRRTPQLLGLTHSEELADHLQSYCLLFDGPELIAAPSMRLWWHGMRPISNRRQVIRRYELGLSAHFRAHGVTLASLFQPTDEQRLLALARAMAIGRHVAYLPLRARWRAWLQPDRASQALAQEIAAGRLEPAALLRAAPWPDLLGVARQLNPTHYLWDALIDGFGVVKRDFLAHSPFAPQAIAQVRDGTAWHGTPASAWLSAAAPQPAPTGTTAPSG